MYSRPRWTTGYIAATPVRRTHPFAHHGSWRHDIRVNPIQDRYGNGGSRSPCGDCELSTMMRHSSSSRRCWRRNEEVYDDVTIYTSDAYQRNPIASTAPGPGRRRGEPESLARPRAPNTGTITAATRTSSPRTAFHRLRHDHWMIRRTGRRRGIRKALRRPLRRPLQPPQQSSQGREDGKAAVPPVLPDRPDDRYEAYAALKQLLHEIFPYPDRTRSTRRVSSMGLRPAGRVPSRRASRTPLRDEFDNDMPGGYERKLHSEGQPPTTMFRGQQAP